MFGALLALTGCLTPMNADEIAALSVCPPGVKLDKVRTNLLEAGFIVKDQGKADLTTDYHDETLLSDSKVARRITVIQDDKGQLHFKVWEKKVYFEPAARFGVGSAFAAVPHGMVGSGFVMGIGPECEHSFEEQRVHYEQYRGQYEADQRMICGGGDKK